jgi:outer membrane protein TolC
MKLSLNGKTDTNWYMMSCARKQMKRHLRRVIALMFLSNFGVCLAQPSIEAARERTRQTIEAVRAELPGRFDDVRSLGATLDGTSAHNRSELWKERTRSENTPKDSLPQQMSIQPPSNDSTFLREIQWPELAKPGPRRLLDRPSAANEESGSKVQFTPDFTRQRLTLSVLAGRGEIDLPQSEINDQLQIAAHTQKISAEPPLSLPDLVGIGLSHSPVMDQMMAQLDAAINRKHQARADLMPKLSVRQGRGSERSIGENVESDGSSKHKTTSGSVRLTQPLINLPLISDWMVEVNNEHAASWRLQATRETVALAVTQATLNLAAARLNLAHADEQLNSFTRLLEYVQVRSQTGASSKIDLERTRTRVLLARQTRIEQQANYRSMLLELKRLTGQSPSALLLPYLNQLPGLPATHFELRQIAWEQSFELRTIRSEIEAQRRALASSRQRLLPAVGISLERDTSRNVRGVNPRQTDQRAMILMSWDFSLGGKDLYEVGAATAELNNREAMLTEKGERVLQQIDADFALLQSATLRLAAGQAEQVASLEVVNAVNEQLRVGRLGSLIESLDAYERHFSARQRLTQTLTQQMQAHAQLLTRIGMLSDLQRTAQVDLKPKNQ